MTTSFAPSPVDPVPSAVPASGSDLVVSHRDGAVVWWAAADPSTAGLLDLLVETTCDSLEVDYAGVHLLEGDHHHVLAGSDTTFQAPRPRSDSLCGVLLDRHVRTVHPNDRVAPQVIEVDDTAADPTLPQLVHGVDETAPVRFHAAAPLHLPDGGPLGTLCVIAHHPRTLTPSERRTLLVLGVAASTVLAGCRSAQGG